MDHISLRTQEDWRRERSTDHTGNDHVHHTCETLMDCLAESRYGRLNNFYVWSFQCLRNWPDGGTKLMRLMRKCQREMRYVTVTVQDVTARLGRTQLIIRCSLLPQCPLEVFERVGKRPSLGKVLLGDVTAHVESRIDLAENVWYNFSMNNNSWRDSKH